MSASGDRMRQRAEAAEARATTAEAERDKLRGLLEDLGRDLLDVTAERDALQAQKDAALAVLRSTSSYRIAERAIAALTDPPKAEPERDPADYGYGHGEDLDPEETQCRTCGHMADEHTPGRFSIYGVCPPKAEPETGER